MLLIFFQVSQKVVLIVFEYTQLVQIQLAHSLDSNLHPLPPLSLSLHLPHYHTLCLSSTMNGSAAVKRRRDNSKLFTSEASHRLGHLFRNTTATCVATLEGHSRGVSSVAFHPTAQLLATGSLDATVKLWQLSCDNSSATCVAILKGHSVYSVAFHPTAPLLASGSCDRTVKLWR